MAERREGANSRQRPMPSDLTKDDSMVIKGVAILAMMWHHCFLPNRFESYDLVFSPLGVGRVVNIAGFFKICVSLFAFVSGYGLYCSLKGSESREFRTGKWYLIRYLKTFSDYWPIVILLCTAGQLINGGASAAYMHGSIFNGVVNFILDLLGLAAFFKSPQFIGTWWYMSTALVYIILAPFLYLFIRRFGSAPLVIITMIVPRLFYAGCPGATHTLSFLMAFVMGMTCADLKPIQRLKTWSEKSRKREVLLTIALLVLLVFCYKFDWRMTTKLYWDIKWGLFAAAYAIIIAFTLSRIRFVRDVLMFFGRWSAHLYLIHTFFRAKYTASFVYGQGGHFLMVIVRLLAVSLLACLLFRLFKRLTRYDDHVKKLIAWASK